MRKTLTVLAFVITMLHSQNISSQTIMENVWISHYYDNDVTEKKGNKASKAPANIPFEVYISKEECKIYIYSSSNIKMEYDICDNSNTPLLSGNSECSSSSWTTINLECLSSGTYDIYLIVDESVYKGTLEI